MATRSYSHREFRGQSQRLMILRWFWVGLLPSHDILSRVPCSITSSASSNQHAWARKPR